MNISASVAFGGIFGSAAAGASAIRGSLLPPSHNMFIYSITGERRISITDHFPVDILPRLLPAKSLIGAALPVA